ncbi:hypothetical protein ACEN9D_06050 [Pseudomonas sp. CT11-2]|uniref:hypothetical protein n=1 Tax=Pseudomonas sp. CT11-2 TaxID=3243023 RepID=UPI0039AFC2F6
MSVNVIASAVIDNKTTNMFSVLIFVFMVAPVCKSNREGGLFVSATNFLFCRVRRLVLFGIVQMDYSFDAPDFGNA